MTKSVELEELAPKFYGVATLGERGQVVIPIEARRDFGLNPSSKLLVLGGHERRVLILAKAESAAELLTKAMNLISRYEQMLKGEVPEEDEE